MKPKIYLFALAIFALVASMLAGIVCARNNALQDFKKLYSESIDNVQKPSADVNLPQGGLSGDLNEEQRVSFLAAGDIVLHESVFLDANLRAGESGVSGSVNAQSAYDFLPMYKYVADAISLVDVAMVNQETLVAASASGIPQGYPGFSGPAAAGDVLAEVGFDIVNIGNNHMLDQGSSGLNRSMDYWKSKNNIKMIGAYSSKSQCDDFLVIEKEGIKIAVLPYLGNTPGTNGYTPDSSLYIPYLNENLVREQMTRAREAADCVIVTIHWGTEGTYTPNFEQTSYAEMFAALGADALIGTHPHVLQPIEWVERAGYAKGGKMLVCYSLGDFLSHTQLAGGKNRLGNLLGGYVQFDIVKEDGSVSLENVVFTPTVSHYDEGPPLDVNFCIYPLEIYTEALLNRFVDPNAGFV